jgi:hypothetical protein
VIEVGSDRFKVPEILFHPAPILKVPPPSLRSPPSCEAALPGTAAPALARVRPRSLACCSFLTCRCGVQGLAGGAELGVEVGPSLAGVAALVVESVNKCDVDLRRELFNTILVSPAAHPARPPSSGPPGGPSRASQGASRRRGRLRLTLCRGVRVQLAGGSTLFSSFKDRLEREVQEVSPPALSPPIVAAPVPPAASPRGAPAGKSARAENGYGGSNLMLSCFADCPADRQGEGDRQQYQRGKTLQVRHVADSLTQGSRHCPRGALGSGRRPRTEGSNQRKLFRGASFEFGGLHQMLTASLRAVSVCSHPAPAPRKRTFPSLPCSSSPLQRVDRRIHSGLPRHLPTDVALQKRVSFG